MYCNHCGGKIPDGARFCNVCGKELAVSQPEPKKSPEMAVGSAFQTVNYRTAGWLSIASSALILLSFFFPWASVPMSSSQSKSVFGMMLLLWNWFGSDFVLVAFIVLLQVVLLVIAVCLHIAAIRDGLSLLKSKQDGLGVMFRWAGIFTLALIVVFAISLNIANGFMNMFSSSNFKISGGAIICGIVTVAQMIAVPYFDKLIGKKIGQERDSGTIVCPHCGKTYIKLTATTRCPACHKLPGDEKPNSTPIPTPIPMSKPKADNITCPFCKRVYPKGTIYCEICKAQIGAAEAVKKQEAYCSACGCKLNANDKFCPQCGIKH